MKLRTLSISTAIATGALFLSGCASSPSPSLEDRQSAAEEAGFRIIDTHHFRTTRCEAIMEDGDSIIVSRSEVHPVGSQRRDRVERVRKTYEFTVYHIESRLYTSGRLNQTEHRGRQPWPPESEHTACLDAPFTNEVSGSRLTVNTLFLDEPAEILANVSEAPEAAADAARRLSFGRASHPVFWGRTARGSENTAGVAVGRHPNHQSIHVRSATDVPDALQHLSGDATFQRRMARAIEEQENRVSAVETARADQQRRINQDRQTWNRRSQFDLSRGDTICTYDSNFFGNVESIEGDRVQMYVVGRAASSRDGFFFRGGVGRFQHVEVNAPRWFDRDQVAPCRANPD
ncbi:MULTISPECIES: hypothetical protein [unclassified Thioalkalivibrio]|uniref:hypothetical protein n=1 Tax=unclassified Thioalkalivibrio TaxID=2621013 RepID=UPI000371985A|nr:MULTISPECIES: hypothetical protein [unclassified Thioalkalivibrio]